VRAGTSPGEELLGAHGLTVAYSENVALRDVDLTLREGEVVALVGPNGSGKTTLFRALAGLAQPARGEVRLAGALAPRSVQARTAFAGFVPQDPAIALYHETVREEIAEGARNRRAPAPSLAEWGVDHLADRNPRDISVGQQQRVALAAMLSHGPRVWLRDEPTRGADGAARHWLAARLRAHASTGGAAIVATHDIGRPPASPHASSPSNEAKSSRPPRTRGLWGHRPLPHAGRPPDPRRHPPRGGGGVIRPRTKWSPGPAQRESGGVRARRGSHDRSPERRPSSSSAFSAPLR
jgi:energy-coupling factor transporter ATP-binding protein EcfA2